MKYNETAERTDKHGSYFIRKTGVIVAVRVYQFGIIASVDHIYASQ